MNRAGQAVGWWVLTLCQGLADIVTLSSVLARVLFWGEVVTYDYKTKMCGGKKVSMKVNS